ncbi:MAG: copper-binding protein [Burkholderiales bacterium]|nr:copper-binding protein [Burkholderiales bacterium]
MKRSISILASLLLASGAVLASGDHKGHSGHGQGDKKAAAPAAGALADGEVRKIEKERGRITLRHGEIKNLDMPPMTMVFRVKDPAMLDQVKEGDKIGFTAEKVGGQYTVMSIEARK